MSVRPLCLEPHPALRRSARPVAAFAKELRHVVRDLIDTMYANNGIGLAAPQIGLDLQVFVASPAQERGREVVMVNPVLERSTGRAGVTEGCLSVPDRWEQIRRAASVQMRAHDVTGRLFHLEASGLLAIVLQHEFDHLQGQLFIDRLPWFRRGRLWVQARAVRGACA